MQQHDFAQGTSEWHQHRATHFNASDAPAMMGVSPYKSRTELLREKATGVASEVDAATQRRFDDGHRFETLARPLAEETVGDALFPCVGSDGRLSASFDGLTMFDDTCWEHKTLNDSLRGITSAAELPEHNRIQLEQQLMVSGASRCLFMATRWNDDDTLAEPPVAVWYESDLSLAARIADGWAQFAKDLEAFQHVEETPVVTGRAPDALPALRIEVTGMVTASNLAEFKSHALAVFDGIKTDLHTDEDFANADKTTKWCKEVEDRLEAAKQHALSQTVSIDELFRTIDSIKEEARQKRLTLEKLVKSRKDGIRIEKVQAANAKFAEHVAALQADIQGVRLSMLVKAPDFAGAIKGLKTIASLDDKIDTALANGKIEADRIAKEVREKLTWLNQSARHFETLFDFQHLVGYEMDAMQAVVKSRIAEQQAHERARVEAKLERIRKDETTKNVDSTSQPLAASASCAEVIPLRTEEILDKQDVIGAFLKSRNFADEGRVRSILIEFVKFEGGYKKAAA